MANTYTPDLVFPPGDTLRELLGARDMQQAELARRLAMSEKAISHLMNGKMALTYDTAIKLERVLGVDASFWTNLEDNYRVFLARQNELEQLQANLDFLKNFPVAAIQRLGIITTSKDKTSMLKELMSFFGIANPEAWNRQYGDTTVQFRKTHSAPDDTYASSVLLRWSVAQTELAELPAFDAEAFRQCIATIRQSGQVGEVEYLTRLPQLVGAAGVSLVITPSLPKSKVSGAVQWHQKRPVILLTTRHKLADTTWFTFFHEAAHVLLHAGQAFLDTEFDEETSQEAEANAWAANQIIPADQWAEFVDAADFKTPTVRSFAAKIGVHPCMVAGRLKWENRVVYSALKTLRLSLNDTDLIV